jgi:dTDP-glucose 4,6-dehydratase
VRILVTGGAGFIGSHFARRLAAGGDEVVVLDKLTYSGNRANLEGAPVEFLEGDICDADAVAEAGAGCEAVVNFAAETHVDRSILGAAEFIETDVLGTYVLVTWARDARARLVQVSTDEVYGDVPEGSSSREDDALRPSSPYSASKAGGDLQVLAAVRTHGVDACVTRGANTYGPNQYPEKLVPLFVTNALDGEPLPVYGDGRQRREWLHVDDHCAAVELVFRAGQAGEAYNVGGEEQENLTVSERILELTGADPALVRHVDDRPGHDRRYSLDDSKLRGLG